MKSPARPTAILLFVLCGSVVAESPPSGQGSVGPSEPHRDRSALTEVLMRIDGKLAAVGLVAQKLMDSAARSQRIREHIDSDPDSRREAEELIDALRQGGQDADRAMEHAMREILMQRLAERLLLGIESRRLMDKAEDRLMLLHNIAQELRLMNATLAGAATTVQSLGMLGKKPSTNKEYRSINRQMSVSDDIADPYYAYFNAVVNGQHWLIPQDPYGLRPRKVYQAK